MSLAMLLRGERFEASDELVCTSRRLFEVLILLFLEVVHFLLEVI